MPLVCGANHFLAACVRPVASSAGSSHGDSRSFPPLRLFIDMSKVHKLIKPITKSLFPNALTLKVDGSVFMNRIAFAPDSKSIVAADCSGTLVFWDLATGHRIATLKDTVHDIGLAYAPNGLSVATGNNDGVVKLWNPVGVSEPRSLIGHTAVVLAVAFS